MIVACSTVEHGGDARQPVDVGIDVPTHLQLVKSAAVVPDDLLERLGQAVVDALALLLVGGRDGID